MTSKSSLKAFREKFALIQSELRDRIESESAGLDASPEAVQSRRAQVFDPVTGFLFFVNTYLPHHFRHAETRDVLKTMSHDEFEDWRDSDEDYRRELTHVGCVTCTALKTGA